MKIQTRFQDLVKIAKNYFYKSRFKKLKSMNDLNHFEIPGVNPQKNEELFTNWHKHVPVKHQDVICPRPQEAISRKFNIGQEKKKQI